MSGSSQSSSISKHRLGEARRLGLSPRSPELTTGVILLAAAWMGQVCLPPLGLALQDLVIEGFRREGFTASSAVSGLSPAVIRVGQEVLRIGAACWAAALVADLAQVGFVWSPVTILPHEERISPASGLTRMFSWQIFERASLLSIKVLLGIIVVAGLSALALRSVIAGSSLDEGETSLLWGLGIHWTSLALACAGVGCLLTGILDAWVRQSRWRVALEQTEDERRRGD